MNNQNYNKTAYQTFDLTNVGSAFLIQNFINKNYNFIDGYFFDYDLIPSYRPLIIQNFKIDDLDILPRGFMLDNIYKGKSIPFNDRFTKINIPISQGKLRLEVRQFILTVQRVTITFRLSNTDDKSLNYKDFYKYDCHFFEMDLLQKIVKKTFRPKISFNTIKGVSLDIFPQLNSSNTLKLNQIGSFKLSINSKKSNPINIPIYEHKSNNIKYSKEFIELNEQVESGSTMDLVLENHLGSIPSIQGIGNSLTVILTIKSI